MTGTISYRRLWLNGRTMFSDSLTDTSDVEHSIVSDAEATVRTLGDYGRSDRVTTMGVWSEGFSCARGPLSISQASSRSASVGDNKK